MGSRVAPSVEGGGGEQRQSQGALGLRGTVGELRAAYESGRTRSLAWRQSQLRGLLRLLAEEEAAAFRALREDLGKHHAEAYRDEIGLLVKSANAALREVEKWMTPEKVWVPLIAFPATAQVEPEPLGVVLVFACWNFPLA
ncbi:hypothetical protein GUJ93_ZPchr0004g39468 [Zizania palustris]|uniref:Aldehyde dehydrogenase domain-containing protein n=1 Tax=Zizania palustris TaxID=103762 RepID=A0A8J5T0X5_ZIZPA|nr:hypothetical protein GUJ93_ZPchr0004g39468 [Zizania palustris]